MMKSLCSFVRKEGLTRQQFQDYYEQQHAPLGVQHFPFARYVRNHIVNGPEIGIETISEFWAEDLAALVEPLKGPVGAIMAADESRFMQRERCEASGSEELVLSEGSPTDAEGRRSAVLLRWLAADATAALVALQQWAGTLAQQQTGVSLDLLRAFPGEKAFAADAVLWMPDYASAPPPPAVLAVTPLRVQRFETPAAQLLPFRTCPPGEHGSGQ